MTQEFLVNTEHRCKPNDIRLGAGERLVFTVTDQSLNTPLYVTFGTDPGSDPLAEFAGVNSVSLGPAELAVLEEGWRGIFNLWMGSDDGRVLLQQGAFSMLMGIAPLNVPDHLSLSGTPQTELAPGEAYLFEPGVSGGTAPYSFAINQGSLPNGLVLNAATGAISGTVQSAMTSDVLRLTVTDAEGLTAHLADFTITVAEPVAAGVAMVWRWGQSNEGTLGNNPSQVDAGFRGAFPGIRQLDNLGNTMGPDESYALVPYAILNTGDAPVTLDGQLLSAPRGEFTAIGDGIPVGPTFGMANDIRDGALFASAAETWFWKAASAGKTLSYFVPEGEVAPHAAGESNLHWGWRFKAYANRQLRTEIAGSAETVYLQCMGDWQGEADVANAAGNPASPYITDYAAEHAKVYQSDADVLGVEPPYFKIALRRIWDGSQADPVTDALNAEMAAMCRYSVDLNGVVADTGSGHPRMYLVEHGFSGVASQSNDPHVSAEEQRQIGLAIAAALRNLHGGDGFTTAYPVTQVKPQLTAVEAALSGADLEVSGFVSDPGTLTIECRDTGGALVGSAQVTVTDMMAGQNRASATVTGLPTGMDITWQASLTLASGEVSVARSGVVTTAAQSVARLWDDTFNTSDFTYSTTASSGDTVTRLATIGARYPRAIPSTATGRIYFEIATSGGILFAGVGTTSSPQNGGENGTFRSGILNTNIQHTGGSVSASVNLGVAQVIRVAVDIDAGVMWIRSEDMSDWNNTSGTDPASGAGGIDISGMDLSAIVPMVGIPSEAAGVEAVLRPTSAEWGYAAPVGFGPIG